MFYISYHGGSGTASNNLFAYTDAGKLASSAGVLTGSKNLDELRAFAFHNGQLYVVNGNKNESAVLCFDGPDASGNFKPAANPVFASQKSVNSIAHPFDLAFAASGNGYVSNQDTNVVTALNATGDALPVASDLMLQFPGGHFLAGTLVASAVGDLPRSPTPLPPNVPIPQGLTVQEEKGKVSHSVRGIVCFGSVIYVADEPDNSVKAYDLNSGKYLGKLARTSMEQPVHLFSHQNTLYIGAEKSVFSYDLTLGAPTKIAKPEKFIDKELSHVSGMTFDGAGNFYAAERKKREIKKFSASGKEIGTFMTNLPDNPEFIQWVVG